MERRLRLCSVAMAKHRDKKKHRERERERASEHSKLTRRKKGFRFSLAADVTAGVIGFLVTFAAMLSSSSASSPLSLHTRINAVNCSFILRFLVRIMLTLTILHYAIREMFKKIKKWSPFPSHLAHGAALMSDSVALSQADTSRSCETTGTGPVHRTVCLFTPPAGLLP